MHGDEEVGPWNPWYDKTFGQVVAAPDEPSARALAQKNAGAERFEEGGDQAWTDPTLSTCEELTAGDCAKVIIEDNRRA